MKLTGAQIIIRELIREGACTVFGYPGGSVLDIYDELYKSREKIKHITTAHEQGAAHAADGYARVTGKCGAVIATSGPGATNLVTGIATAYLDSVPLVALTGNVATDFIGLDSFQEVGIVGITMPITKHNYIVGNVAELSKTLREAFFVAKSGRPGPVLVDIPKDVQRAVAEYDESVVYAFEQAVRQPEPQGIEEALELIKNAERPCIYAGGGCVIANAHEELAALSERIDAPLTLSLMGLTAVSHKHKYHLGFAGMHGRYAASKAIAECDLLIAVGTRFSDRATGSKKNFAKDAKVLHIDIDRAEINKNVKTYARVIGDVRDVLKRLLAELKSTDRARWANRFLELKNSEENKLIKCDKEDEYLTPGYVIRAVRDALGRDATVATDVGQHQMWTAQYFDFDKPRSFVTSGGLGTMGYGMGAAIGAAAGSGRRSILFTSDGSFHMNLNEMATAVSQKTPLIIILLDNNALGMVRQWQTMFYHKRYSETALERVTDYVALAQAFGASGANALNKKELAEALIQAQSVEGPFLIRCVIDHDEKVFPMIPPNGTIKDIVLE